jgi:hypothetical protein
MTWIVLATEDELSEQVGLCLAEEAGLEVGQRLRKQGNGYLHNKITNFCEMARQQPVLLITDLDQATCASALISEWMGKRSRPDKLLFRVAVREVESWLLADHEGMKTLLGSRVGGLPQAPDDLPDPKGKLLALAQKAPRDVREALVIKRGAVASQGLGYNALLCQWIREVWRLERAAERSDSLSRARSRLRELAGQERTTGR